MYRTLLTLLALPSLLVSAPAEDLSAQLKKAIEGAKAPPASARGDALYQDRQYEDAAEAYLEHVARRPDDANAWYNLACCLSLAGRKEDAVSAFRQAVKAGFTDADHIKGDTDLDAIREEKSFQETMQELEDQAGSKPKAIWVTCEALLPCYVRKPKKYSSKKEYGLLLLLHGRGDAADRFLRSVEDWRGDDFIVASLETPYTVGGVGDWIGRCWSPWESGKDNIPKAYVKSAENVGKALKALREDYKVDPKRTYLFGFSEGAFLAAHCGFMHAGEVAGWVCAGGGIDKGLVKDEDFAKLKGQRILIAHGTSDRTVPFTSGKALRKMLSDHGVAHEFFPYGGGHTLTRDMREQVHAWLRGAEIDEDAKAEEPGAKPKEEEE
jgi:phospholipase/carboxylesterase